MEAVYGALSNPESLSRVGKNARETIYFSWDSIMDDVIARYEDLIERFHSR